MKTVKDFLSYNVWSSIVKESSSWGKIRYSNKLDEGIRLRGEAGNQTIEVDFDKDEEGDVVNLAPPVTLSNVRTGRGSASIEEVVPVFRGFKLEKSTPDAKSFIEIVKKWGALNPEDLKSLIDLTYPEELKRTPIKIIFTTGSSDPLASHIADAVREMYYPKAKVIDIMKKYYGSDVNDIINWEAYDRADPKTKDMIDSYLRQFKTVGNRRPRNKFEGYIKKSSGLQSGARGALMPGHMIDDYIISNIISAELEWRTDYQRNKDIGSNIAMKYRPGYLFVDDTMVGGTTMRGIFRQMMAAISSDSVPENMRSLIRRSIFGYCLFSWKG